MSDHTDKLPERRDLSSTVVDIWEREPSDEQEAYARAERYVRDSFYPPSILGQYLGAPSNSRERYLLSLAIEAIREHERRLRAARTKLAAMRSLVRAGAK